MRILIVDDNPDDRLLVERILKEEISDLEVREAKNAREFHQALKARQFDVVVTDYQLSWSTGLEILREVMAKCPDLPVIMLTDTGTEEVAVQGMKLGLADYILKKRIRRLPTAVRRAMDRMVIQKQTAHLEVRLRTLLNKLDVGVFRAALDGRILEANQAFLRILGYGSLREARRKNFLDLIVEEHDRKILTRELETRRAFHVKDLQMLRKDGQVIWVTLTEILTSTPEGKWIVEGLIEDISEWRQQREALNRLAAVIQQSEESVIITDPDGKISYVNPAFERLTVFRIEEVLTQDVRTFLRDSENSQVYDTIWRTILSGKTWQGTLQNRRKNGTVYFESLIVFPILDGAGKTMNYAIIKRDITKEKQLEENLYQAQKLESIGQLAGGIAHDFNNILTVILGCAEVALSRLKPEDSLWREISGIIKAGERAATLTQQLLTFSRKQIIRPIILDINQVILEIEKMLSRLIGEDIELELKLQPEVSKIEADRGQIEQVLMNLIINARDAINERNDKTAAKKSLLKPRMFIWTRSTGVLLSMAEWASTSLLQ